ncbi:MAG: Rne/Rng family ribonuclease [Victivallales bacterium]|nr:Rne/Rng family ribonuclease [Victivallales bacterium]
MKKNVKQMILNCEMLERRFAMLNDGRLEEYQIERDDSAPKVGNIYLGKIINLEPALQAAFIDIGADKNAFLHYHEMLPGGDELLEKQIHEEEVRANKLLDAPISAKRKKRQEKKLGSKALSEELRRKKKLTVEDIPEFFKPGMELLVQVVKSPIGTKGARVTTNMSIPGRYLVLMPYSEHIGLSTRIEGNQERDRLRKILSALELPEGMGLICRTVGEGQKAAFFKRDLELLLDYWHKIEQAMETKKAPVEVFAEPNLIARTIRDFMTAEIGGIIVDDKETCKKIADTLRKFGGAKMAEKVTLYNSPRPIFDQYRVNEQLREVYQREVRLPGGGYICIDETEALIAIDVNSGRGRKGTDQPEFILQTNLEAAAEIARQLRLRNIGGLVVLDFIDMRGSKDRDEVMRTMKKLVKDDRAKTKVLPISKLGLMEMTRQREHESILDQVYNPCPYCSGTGRVKSPVTMSVEIQRRLNSILRDRRYKDVPVRVIMHPEVLARLRNEDAQLLTDIEEKYHHALSFRADPALHYEEFRLLDPDTGAELR